MTVQFFDLYLQFISSLKDNLNAEVALGTVTNVKEACLWLGYTYLSVRMKLNPLAYGIGWDEVFIIHNIISTCFDETIGVLLYVLSRCIGDIQVNVDA